MKVVIILSAAIITQPLLAASNDIQIPTVRVPRSTAFTTQRPILRGATQAEIPIKLEKRPGDYRLVLQDGARSMVVTNAFDITQQATHLLLELDKTYSLIENDPAQARDNSRLLSGVLLKATRSPTGGVVLREAHLFATPREHPVPWNRKQMAYATRLSLGLVEKNPNDASAFLPMTIQLFAPTDIKFEPQTTEITTNGADGFKNVEMTCEKYLSTPEVRVLYGSFEQNEPIAFAKVNWLLRFMPAWCWIVLGAAMPLGITLKITTLTGQRRPTRKTVIKVITEGVVGAVLGVLVVQTGLIQRLLPGWAVDSTALLTVMVCIVFAFVGGSAVSRWLWASRKRESRPRPGRAIKR